MSQYQPLLVLWRQRPSRRWRREQTWSTWNSAEHFKLLPRRSRSGDYLVIRSTKNATPTKNRLKQTNKQQKQTDKQTNRQTNKQTNTQTNKQNQQSLSHLARDLRTHEDILHPQINEENFLCCRDWNQEDLEPPSSWGYLVCSLLNNRCQHNRFCWPWLWRCLRRNTRMLIRHIYTSHIKLSTGLFTQGVDPSRQKAIFFVMPQPMMESQTAVCKRACVNW